ncbi:MAG: hypothetical protein QOJ40_846 [Verrucomicrobiota bacterium]
MARTYNSYGHDPTLSLISGLILTDAPAFGPGVSELTVTFHFPHSGPPRISLEQLYAAFHSDRLKLPKVVFERSRGKVSIDIASNLSKGTERERCRDLSLPLLRGAFTETLAALRLLKGRFTAKDDFLLDEFLSHCLQRGENLPRTEDALSLLKKRHNEREAAIRTALSPWERLGIDWRDFHPDARRILDDPFFWKQADDFSPHGNDTGADLLSDYRLWLKRYPASDPLDFYRRLIAGWGFSDESTDPTFRSVSDEAAVALAFAELKLRGACRPSVADLARQALHRQRKEALLAADSPFRHGSPQKP